MGKRAKNSPGSKKVSSRPKPLFKRNKPVQRLSIAQLRRMHKEPQDVDGGGGGGDDGEEEEPAEDELTVAGLARSILESSGVTAYLKSTAGGSLRDHNLENCLTQTVLFAEFTYEQVSGCLHGCALQ